MQKIETRKCKDGRFEKNSIPLNKIFLPKKKLKKLYNDIKSSRRVAKEFKVSKSTVLRNLHEYGISVKKGVPSKLPEYWKKSLRKPKSGTAWNKGLTKENNKSVKSISDKLKGPKNYRWKSKYHTGERIKCKCGCGQLMNKYDKRGRIRYYIKNHCTKGRFNKDNSGGKNNSKWKGGITHENDKIRKSEKYKKWREIIYKRDRYTCQNCESKKDIIAHHIKFFTKYPNLRFIVSNGITLCRSCHLKLHRKLNN